LFAVTTKGTCVRYVEEIADGDDKATIARKVGTRTSTITRWFDGSTAKPSTTHAVKFAVEYHRNVLEAFVAARHLDLVDVTPALDAESLDLLTKLGFGVEQLPGN
jgi:hypothetical protein